jgi:hypothetical protein
MPTRRSAAALEWLAAALLLAGCASSGGTLPPVPALAPLTPASFGGSVQVEQTLSAAYGDRESTLTCVLDVSPQKLTVVGLTATGQRVFTLSYDGVSVTAQRSVFAPKEIAPERILADLQFAFWPLAALQGVGNGWDVSEPREGLRRIRYAGRLVAETHRLGSGAFPERLWLSNFAYGYALDIRSRVIGN